MSAAYIKFKALANTRDWQHLLKICCDSTSFTSSTNPFYKMGAALEKMCPDGCPNGLPCVGAQLVVGAHRNVWKKKVHQDL